MKHEWPSRLKSRAIPLLRSFITLRNERFGALLFNPFLGLELELDPVETYIVNLCNGHNSCRQVEMATARRLGLDPKIARRLVVNTIEKLSDMYAVKIEPGEEPVEAELPIKATFSSEGPYYSSPKRIVWEVSYKCNLKCPHCFTDSGKAREGELNTEQALALIDELAQSKTLFLLLSGGEPFMRDDILILLRHIADTNMRVDIVTNTLAITDNILKELKELPVFQAQVSIDGIGETHDRFRGVKGGFDIACKNIKRLQQAGVNVTISCTATSENLGEIDRIIDLGVKLGCNGFKAIPFRSTGRGRRNSDRLKLNLNEHYILYKTLIERSKELKEKMMVSSEMCFPFLLEAPTNGEGSGDEGHMGCSAGEDTLCIGADGTAYPCPFLHDFPLGNVMEQGVKELWHGSAMLQSLRSLKKQDMKGPCKSCRYAPSICGGGCRAAAYFEYGDLAASDPTCFKGLLESPAE